MVITIKKDTNIQEVIRCYRICSLVKYSSQKILGKIKWGEDALEYQKRMRNEWD
jgi:hypothetical protein